MKLEEWRKILEQNDMEDALSEEDDINPDYSQPISLTIKEMREIAAALKDEPAVKEDLVLEHKHKKTAYKKYLAETLLPGLKNGFIAGWEAHKKYQTTIQQ